MGSASRERVNVKIEGSGKVYALRSTLQISKYEKNPGPAAYNITDSIGTAPTYARVGMQRTLPHAPR